MIKRFNFYDIYGYLLPGLTLLGLLWLPSGLNGLKPQLQLNLLAALLGIAASYVIGHVIQTLARRLLPSETKENRLPSDFILDDGTFPPTLRARLKARVETAFGLNIDNRSDRAQAFFLCRDLLIQKGLGSYAEQFQGMYSLMRGLAVACLLAVPYQFGWVLGGFVASPSGKTGALVAAAGTAAWCLLRRESEKPSPKRVAFAVPLVLASLLAGVGVAPTITGGQDRAVLLVLTIITAFVGRRAYGAHPAFAKSFAATVYRCFLMLDQNASTAKIQPDDNGGLEVLKEP